MYKRITFSLFSVLIALALVACGGSNSDDSSSATSGSSKVNTSGSSAFTIGGTVSGLSGQVTLLNNGANPLTLATNRLFVFTSPVASNSSYNLTVSSQPLGQICTVSNGSGSGVIANISNVSVV